MRRRHGWMVAMLAIVAVGITAAQRNDHAAVLKGNCCIWRLAEDFMTGFVVSDKQVWGRPVGLTVAKDGSLIVTEDGSGTIWRVSYQASGSVRPRISTITDGDCWSWNRDW